MDCSDRRNKNFSVSHKKQRKARKKQGILYDASRIRLDKSCGSPAFLLVCRRKLLQGILSPLIRWRWMQFPFWKMAGSGSPVPVLDSQVWKVVARNLPHQTGRLICFPGIGCISLSACRWHRVGTLIHIHCIGINYCHLLFRQKEWCSAILWEREK